MELSNLRKKIDQLDADIVCALIKRFDIAVKIGDKKNQNNTHIEDKERDTEVLENYLKNSGERLDEEFIHELVELILRYSKEVQKK